MIKDQKIKLITRMNELESLIPDTVEAVKSLPDNINGKLYTLLSPGELTINIQYLPEEYLSLRRELAKDWKYKTHWFNELTGSIYVGFQHKSLKVELDLELEIATEYQDGATCKLVEIGHKTEIVYGLECK